MSNDMESKQPEAPSNDAPRCEETKAYHNWANLPCRIEDEDDILQAAWMAAIAWERSRNVQTDERRPHAEETGISPVYDKSSPSDPSEIQRLNSIIKEQADEINRLGEALNILIELKLPPCLLCGTTEARFNDGKLLVTCLCQNRLSHWNKTLQSTTPPATPNETK